MALFDEKSSESSVDFTKSYIKLILSEKKSNADEILKHLNDKEFEILKLDENYGKQSTILDSCKAKSVKEPSSQNIDDWLDDLITE